jgi:purine-binding chemotaxis protein CheW
MCVIVDAVEDVSTFTDADIEPTPDFGDLVETKFILGMSKSKGVVKTILDIDQIILVDGDLSLPVFEPSTETSASAS